MATGADVVQRLGLVAPELGDALGLVHRPYVRVDPVGPRLDDGLACRDVLDMRDPFAVAKDDVGGIHERSLPDRHPPIRRPATAPEIVIRYWAWSSH